MKLLKETTTTFPPKIRHTYLTTKDKSQLLGYIPVGQTKLIRFKIPKQFTYRDRTFQEIKM